MELNKQHREALMSELKKAKEKLRFNKQAIKDNHISENLIKWYEISIFLATERISLIEKSIIDNEIDY